MVKRHRADKPSKVKRVFKVIGIVLLITILTIASVTLVSNLISNNLRNKYVATFDKVVYENQLAPTLEDDGYYTFTTDNDFKVLQLTDIHIGGGAMSTKKDKMALNAVAAMITYEKPDLVIVTGDLAYPVPYSAGTFNNLSSSKSFANLMETLGVYWTISFGNHDTEAYSYYNRKELSEFYSKDEFKYCLFTRGPSDIDGFGNQIFKVKNTKGVITQALYVFDSHSYTDGDYFGIFWKYDKIKQSQIDWYKTNVLSMDAYNATKTDDVNMRKVKSLAFFHIPLEEYKVAWYAYRDNGYKDTADVKYISGEAGENPEKDVVYCSSKENLLFETMHELESTKGIFVGHDHLNNFSIMYKGIQLSYGNSIDYLAYSKIKNYGVQRGCNVIVTKTDGSFTSKTENYYQEKYKSKYEKEAVTMDKYYK